MKSLMWSKQASKIHGTIKEKNEQKDTLSEKETCTK